MVSDYRSRCERLVGAGGGAEDDSSGEVHLLIQTCAVPKTLNNRWLLLFQYVLSNRFHKHNSIRHRITF